MDESRDIIGTPASLEPGPKRSLILALFLAILSPGLGHTYVGQLRRGLSILGFLILIPTLALAALAYIPYRPLNVIVVVVFVAGFHVACWIDVAISRRRNQDAPQQWYQRWWWYLIYMMIAAVSLNLFYILEFSVGLQSYVIPTANMSDTLMPGDRMVVEKQYLIRRSIRHGDVIVFSRKDDHPDYLRGSVDEPQAYLLVQRVIGLPGDVIEFKDEKLYRNGDPIDEPYARFEGQSLVFMPEMFNFGPLTVPEHELFFVGDNRRLSDDSRFRGTVPIKDVVGHVMSIYWSNVPHAPDHARSAHELSVYGIDDDNPPGKIRWNRFGNRIVNDAQQ